jgi:curved DNA-binding protein CbpA
MRSAYLVLGVPGDASGDEIEAAFRKAEALFPRERLAREEGALARLEELRSAHQVLRDPGSRAAHDRKLLEQVRPAPRHRAVAIAEDQSPASRWVGIGLVLVALVFGAGIYVTHRNAESRRMAAAQELATRQAAEQEARMKVEEEERLAMRRAALAAQAEANERRLVQETRSSVAHAAAEMRAQQSAVLQAQRAEVADTQRREASRLADERRAAQEARMRTDRDKQRVRETCYQLYRRPDC